MSNDRKAVILGRLQRVTTVTPCPQASCPFRLLRSGRCPRSRDACTASRPPAGTRSLRKARVSLSPVCGPYYTRDACPRPRPDTSKCFTRVHRVNALPSRGETALHPCPPRPGGAAPARRCARPPCGPEPFGSEPFSDPAGPLAGPPVPSLPSQRPQDGDPQRPSGGPAWAEEH